MFKDAAQRMVNGEVKDIKRAIKNLRERDSTDFLNWLNDYYEKAPERIRQIMLPVFSTFADMIQGQASQEVGIDPGMTPELERFMGEYTDAFAARYTGSSKGQIKALLRDAPNEGLDPADVIEERLDEWEQKRAGKVAMNETVQAGNAVAKFVFAAAGVTRLRWVAIGAESCPYCQEMDGKVVGIEMPFLGASESLESDDGRMSINRPAGHPPLHQGCVCVIQPE